MNNTCLVVFAGESLPHTALHTTLHKALLEVLNEALRKVSLMDQANQNMRKRNVSQMLVSSVYSQTHYRRPKANHPSQKFLDICVEFRLLLALAPSMLAKVVEK